MNKNYRINEQPFASLLIRNKQKRHLFIKCSLKEQNKSSDVE